MTAPRSLETLVREEIRDAGPMSVARFMALALGHPAHGYYMTRDPLGRDFTTSPEISQMFGELIGLWIADLWARMGRPDPVLVAEPGPGRGTLMADALRAAAILPGFAAAARIHLVETSPVLSETQAQTLAPIIARHGYRTPQWHKDIAGLPAGPLIMVANEFFDALPIRQIVCAKGAWRERCIVETASGGLAFAPSPVPLADLHDLPGMAEAADGTIVELAPAAGAIASTVAARLAREGGGALIIDYGHTRSGPGDTLQAMRGGTFVPVLEAPGEADLTAHVDFEALAAAARAGGAAIHGPVTQGAFLNALGIGERADRLMAAASPGQRDAIRVARERLTAPDAMGSLFKAIALVQPGLIPAGFAP